MALLLVVKHELQRIHYNQVQARIALETTEPDVNPNATAGGDSRKLRGIPAIGQGVTGAIPGTIPGAGLGLSTHLPRHLDPIEDTNWQ
jgi:hypothetical protein